ncbi:MAG: hypothetical protein RJB39_701 [Candidatus Parcubacteria bacterium]|jgi:hypothetical protein
MPALQRKKQGHKNQRHKRKLRPPVFTIFVEEFEVPCLLAAVARCGGYDQKFGAEVSISTRSLDADGFVVHNERLVERIQWKFALDNETGKGRLLDGSVVWKASCEELAAGVANVVASLVHPNRLAAMQVKVFNELGHVTLDWTAGDQIPPFPRRATKQEIKDTKKKNEQQGFHSPC